MFYCRYVARSAQELYDYDVHWRPQVILCNPCVMNYDFVIRFEKLVEDSNLLLEYLQRDDSEKDKLFFKNKTSARIDSNRTSKAFLKINPDILNGLRSVYKDDFAIMGYMNNIP